MRARRLPPGAGYRPGMDPGPMDYRRYADPAVSGWGPCGMITAVTAGLAVVVGVIVLLLVSSRHEARTVAPELLQLNRDSNGTIVLQLPTVQAFDPTSNATIEDLFASLNRPCSCSCTETCPPGPPGDDGLDAAPCVPCVDGADGTPGATGPIGPQGPNGTAGVDGVNGNCTCPLLEDDDGNALFQGPAVFNDTIIFNGNNLTCANALFTDASGCFPITGTCPTLEPTTCVITPRGVNAGEDLFVGDPTTAAPLTTDGDVEVRFGSIWGSTLWGPIDLVHWYADTAELTTTGEQRIRSTTGDLLLQAQEEVRAVATDGVVLVKSVSNGVNIECGGTGATDNSSCVIQSLSTGGRVLAQSQNQFNVRAGGGTTYSVSADWGNLNPSVHSSVGARLKAAERAHWLVAGGASGGTFDAFTPDCTAINPGDCQKPFVGEALLLGESYERGCQWDGRCTTFAQTSWLLQVGVNDTLIAGGELRSETDVVEFLATNADGLRALSDRSSTPLVANNQSSAELARGFMQVEGLSGVFLNHTRRNATSGLGDGTGFGGEALEGAYMWWEESKNQSSAANGGFLPDFLPGQDAATNGRAAYFGVGPVAGAGGVEAAVEGADGGERWALRWNDTTGAMVQRAPATGTAGDTPRLESFLEPQYSGSEGAVGIRYLVNGPGSSPPNVTAAVYDDSAGDPRFEVTGKMVLNGFVVDESQVVASDARLKRNVSLLDQALAGMRVDQLRPVHYQWRRDAPLGRRSGAREGTHHHGFIAQEVEKVYGPDHGAVASLGHNKRPELKGVRTDAIVADLVATVQALRKQVRRLEGRVSVLEDGLLTRMRALEYRVGSIAELP